MRANQADITGLRTIDLWHEFHIIDKSEWKEIFGSRGGPASDKIAMSLRARSQILK